MLTTAHSCPLYLIEYVCVFVCVGALVVPLWQHFDVEQRALANYDRFSA